MKKLFTLLAFLTVFMGAKAANWVQVYSIDYANYNGFPFYVMGYVPEWVDGVMTDYGALYGYKTDAEMEEGDFNEVGTVDTNNGAATYHKVLFDSPAWHQYFIADGIKTQLDGTYKVKAMVKASEAVTINVNMGWSWNEDPKSASVSIGTEWAEVEWEYTGIGGTSCNLVAQPGTSTATIEWKSVTVFVDQAEQRPVIWQEWLTDDGQPIIPGVEHTNKWMGDAETPWTDPDVKFNDQEKNYLICAWTKERAVLMNDDGGWDPFPARIEADPADANNKVFVVHGKEAITEGDPAAWDNQFWIQSPKEWKTGEQVKIHFRYKASKAVTVATQCHKQNPSDYLVWHAIGDINFTEEWQEYDDVMNIGDDMGGTWSIAFQLNQNDKAAIDFYFDDLSWQSMKLDEGYFVAASNTTTGIQYDFDNAIEFVQDPDDEEVVIATVGTEGKQDTWVNEVMISTVRGETQSFKANTIKPKGDIACQDPDNWQDYEPASLCKINLPAAGVWKISIAPSNDPEKPNTGQILFWQVEGDAPAEPEAIVTNKTAIVVHGLEREDLIDNKNQDGSITVREEADDPAGEAVGGDGHNGQTWDNQFFIKSNRALEKDQVTVLKFKYKASKEAKTTTQCHGETPGAYMHWAAIGDVTFTTEWQDFEKEFTIPSEANGMYCIAFNMAEIREACDYEITDVEWYLKADCNAEGKTPKNLINETGSSNFYVKEGAGTTPYIFGGGDGIFTVTNHNVTTDSNVIYNLSGQRVGADYKGIVIKNGKKVVVK